MGPYSYLGPALGTFMKMDVKDLRYGIDAIFQEKGDRALMKDLLKLRVGAFGR